MNYWFKNYKLEKVGEGKVMKLTGRIILLISVSTTLILTFTFGFLTIRYNRQVEKTLLNSSRSLYKMVLTVRHWASDYEGVLVKKTPGVKINPFLKHPILVTVHNDTLVLKNPALITRELSELSKDLIGDAFFHMASDRYLNPENKPDAFEARALAYLKTHRDKKEFYGFERHDNKVYFRYFAPLYTEKSCLRCHAAQGYKEGDLRGGVSIHISAASFEQAKEQNLVFMLFFLLGAILILSTILYFGLRHTIIRPIEALTTAAEKLEIQDYDFPLVPPRNASTEITKVFAAFNRMRQSILTSLSQLQDSEAKYRLLIENSLEAIALTNRNGVIIETNRRFLDLLGLKKEEIVGKKIQEIIDSRKRTVFDESVQSEFPTRHYETILTMPGQMKIPVEIFEISDIPLIPEEQITFYYLRDLRLRKKLEQYSIQMEKMLVLGELSAGIAHEVRNPLFALTNNLDYLKRELKDRPVFNEIYPELLESLNKIHKIVSVILEFASPHQPELKRVNLLGIIDKCLVLVRKKFEKAHIKIEQEFHGDCFEIWADPYQMEQVFVNLFMNAFKAMKDHGELRITGRCTASSVEVTIQDNGIGISEENISRIFDPFYTQFETGTGLGLSIVQKILTQHHAKICVESKPQEGATFTIFFPSGKKVGETEA